MKRTQGRRKDVTSMGQVVVSSHGFSLIELMVTVAILLIASAIAIPLVQSASTSYQIRSAVDSVTGTIQSTRYQAISNGYMFRLAMSKAAATYQVWKNDPTNGWVKVGNAVPLSSSSVNAALSADTTLDFYPGGSVLASTGALTFSLTLKGTVENIGVSTYGSISVSP